jgi:two-component system, OmpR family, sensor histidine kinase ChvG
MDKGRIILDPDRLPLIEGARVPFRTDQFAEANIAISPEGVAPVLRRLLQLNSTVRARVYDATGKLIIDSASLLARGQIARAEPSEADHPRAKTNRTRFFEIFGGASVLPVYQDIGTADGTTYPEVKMALTSGTTTPMLLLTQDGDQIVSIAAPIRRADSVQGVLLLSSKPGEIDEILAAERKAIATISGFSLLCGLLMLSLVSWAFQR